MPVLFSELIRLPEWSTVETAQTVDTTRSVTDAELILAPHQDYTRDVLYCIPWQTSLYDPAIDAIIRRLARDEAAGLMLILDIDVEHSSALTIPEHLMDLAMRLNLNICGCPTDAFSNVWTAIKQRLVSEDFSRLQKSQAMLDKLQRFAMTCMGVEEFVTFASETMGRRLYWESHSVTLGKSHQVKVANETIGYLVGDDLEQIFDSGFLDSVGQLAAAIHLADVMRLQVKSHLDSDLLRMLFNEGMDKDALAVTFRRARLNPDAPTRVAALTMRYGVASDGPIRFWDPIFLELEQAFGHRSLRLLTGYVSGYPTILIQNPIAITNSRTHPIGDDVAAIIRKVIGDDVIMGVSTAAPLREGCNVLFQEAVEAVTIGRALDRSDAIVRYEGLGEDRVFYMLLTSPFAMQLARNMLYPLVKADNEQGTDYVDTVAAYVLNDRKLSETAKLLHLHRNSLRYRLSHIEQILGFSFTDTERVLLLQLAVLSHRLQGDKLMVESNTASQ